MLLIRVELEKIVEDDRVSTMRKKVWNQKFWRIDNRSAQQSRVRKLQYISELERNVNSLQAKVSVLSPRVAYLDHQRLILNVDNSILKQRIATLSQDKIFKDVSNKWVALVDPRLGTNFVASEMFRMIEAAVACVRHSATKRPRMGQILRAFESLEAKDPSNGIKVGQSEIYNSA
ncbi:hypothetical protein Tco_0588566 [Tanacetum coccineum]